MASIAPALLQAITQELARLPADPTDLAIAAAQLSGQLDGLARLDELDLLHVEPAVVLLPPAEEPRDDR